MRNILLGLALLVPLATSAAPMTNADVIKMVKGGLGEATVLQAIDAAEAAFDTSPDGLVMLKGGGVSDAVIQRVITRKSATPGATPGVAPGVAAAPGVAPAAAAGACRDCGTISGIREIDKPGQASGVGAIAGGVLGGVLGRQLGGGNHRTAGTVLGAVGGGVAGHQIEKHTKAGKISEIEVRFDDASFKVFTQDTHPSWNTGTRVRLVNGALAPL